MKKLRVSILLLCTLMSGCTKDYCVEMDVISAHSLTADNWYELDLKAIVHEDMASNRNTCSKEIIQHILDNDFQSILFSFDLNGYPNEVSVDVFTSLQNVQKGKKAYSFEYVTEFNTENLNAQNNIKDNPDEFKIQYEQ